MTESTVARYQPGGDIYAEIQGQYGTQSANTLAQIVRETKESTNVSTYLGELRNGPMQNSNVASIFVGQITTDPFAAPASALNRTLSASVGSAIKGIFSNVWVLALVVFLGFLVFVYIKRALR